MSLLATVLAVSEAAPAGGSALGEVLAGAGAGLVAVAAVVALGVAHRRRGLLRPLATLIEERTGEPAWAVLPGAIATLSLLIAVFGYYWDVSWHIDRGRDAGPFANPAHWFIIVGLDGIAFAGILSLILGDRETRSSVELRRGWHVPVSGLVLTACGLIALAGFPLDDLWHRLFGQDVTAWGPTHIQMIGGASLATIATWGLGVEARRAREEAAGAGAPTPAVDPRVARMLWVREATAGGAFLVGLSTLQVEFDFGVPQFRQLYHPVLIALAAGIALVAARVKVGRGGALFAAGMFVVLRGLLALAIGPGLGRTMMHFPLYLAEALVVEAVALAIPRTRQLTLGVVAGAGVGTVGLAAGWIWSHAWMPLPWSADLLPEVLPLTLLAGVSGGVLGGLVGRALLPLGIDRQPTPTGLAPAAWLGAALCLALPLPMTEHPGWTADLSITPTTRGDETWGTVAVRLDPAEARQAAADAAWFDVLAWQGRPEGDGGRVIAPLEEVGPGTWRSDGPVPLDGTWKSLVRLHQGSSLQALPLYLPEDPAIPAPEVRAVDGGTHAFQREKDVLQREAKSTNVGLERAAYAFLGGIAAVWLAVIAWGLGRLDRSGEPPDPARGPADARRPLRSRRALPSVG